MRCTWRIISTTSVTTVSFFSQSSNSVAKANLNFEAFMALMETMWSSKLALISSVVASLWYCLYSLISRLSEPHTSLTSAIFFSIFSSRTEQVEIFQSFGTESMSKITYSE